MASTTSLASPILLLILFHLLFETDHVCFASNPTGKNPNGLRLSLTRVDFSKNLPKNQDALSSLRKAKNQPKNAPRATVKCPVKASGDLYLTKLAIGTPPVTYSAVVDTGSDLIWTICQSSSRFYDSRKSKSFSKVSCDSFPDGCQQTYADGSSIKVSMGQEMFTMGYMSSNLTFGCGTPSDKKDFKKYDGIVGMGRGKLSLVSQLNEKVFSYCLASRFQGNSEQSILLTGSQAITAIANTKIQTTPLLNQGDSYYYISLEGISVGKTRLSVNKSEFAIKEDKTGGMIIDSGTTFTYLEEGIVNLIEDAFTKQTNLEKVKVDAPYKGLDRCFKDVKIIPKLVFHFSGADWDLPRENYMYKYKGTECLAFIPIEKNDQQRLSIFGNMQQQNMMVLYDLDKDRLSFTPANCNQL